LLEARDATVRFGGLVAVSDVSLRLEAGEIAGLIGPNGAGKTSMLDVLSGSLVPQTGTVHLDGDDVTGWGPERRARAGVARTFQRLELFRHMTVFDNLRVGAEARFGEADFVADLTGRTRRRRAAGVAEGTLARLGLEEVSGRWAGQVPLGIGRLVELGRALCTGPRWLLLDEPASGLDEAETARLAAVLPGLRDEGLGVLLVEHDLDLVMEVCERVLVMDFGRLIAEGTPAEIAHDAAVRAAYLGSEVA
jgi:branched-chain amino acid transport system ATP-binding protein